jgi:hypothetical protein
MAPLRIGTAPPTAAGIEPGDRSRLRPMPFKDTPGLRRIAAAAIEARDVVPARLLPGHQFCDMDGRVFRPGDTMTLPRRQATELAANGVVELVD